MQHIIRVIVTHTESKIDTNGISYLLVQSAYQGTPLHNIPIYGGIEVSPGDQMEVYRSVFTYQKAFWKFLKIVE